MRLTSKTCLRPNEAHVAAKVIDGEAILINLASGNYYSMDKVGARVWERIEVGASVDELVVSIISLYDVAEEEARRDIERLVEALVEEGLVVYVTAASQRPSEQSETATAKHPYLPPELNIYRDMAALLALDPPLPELENTPWDTRFDDPETAANGGTGANAQR